MGMDFLEIREELDSVLIVFPDHLASIAYSFPTSVDVNIILVGHIVDPLGLVITYLQVIKIIIDQGTVELE